ncbi:glycosyltransferase family 4 protein [Streptomyces albus]|uniref:glycosyltransferase family 4 protein n=1 Tax=Streptomyces albus TaxID=1888 RepID=UPI0034527BC4
MSPSRTSSPRRPSVGAWPPHAVHVLGGAGAVDGAEGPSAGTAAHARSLARGLAARGVRVTVCARQDAALQDAFADTGADFVPLHGRTEAEAVAALRIVCGDADLVHAHGAHAGFLAALALGSRRHGVPLVVTWHPRPDPAARTEAARDLVARLLTRRVARAATVVLGATTALVDAARRSGARDARLAPAPIPVPGPAPGTGTGQPVDDEDVLRHKVRAGIGALDRPLVLAVGRLDGRSGHETALTASRAWRRLDPTPLLGVAGEGPQRTALQQRIDREMLPVRLLGRREDALALLAGADVALLPGRCQGRSLVAQEALRAGVPLVAADGGDVPELVGDAALLVPHGDADSLSAAVTVLLTDPAARAALSRAGRARARTWPTEDDAAAQVLSVYDETLAAAAQHR